MCMLFVQVLNMVTLAFTFTGALAGLMGMNLYFAVAATPRVSQLALLRKVVVTRHVALNMELHERLRLCAIQQLHPHHMHLCPPFGNVPGCTTLAVCAGSSISRAQQEQQQPGVAPAHQRQGCGCMPESV